MSKEKGKHITESEVQNSFGFSMKSFGSLLSSGDTTLNGSNPPGNHTDYFKVVLM